MPHRPPTLRAPTKRGVLGASRTKPTPKRAHPTKTKKMPSQAQGQKRTGPPGCSQGEKGRSTRKSGGNSPVLGKKGQNILAGFKEKKEGTECS